MIKNQSTFYRDLIQNILSISSEELINIGKKKYTLHAYIVKKNKVLSSGKNRYSIYPEFKDLVLNNGSDFDFKKTIKYGKLITIHAELDAIINLSFDRKKIANSTLIIAGLTKAGNLIRSKPCANCIEILNMFRIKDIVYINKNGEIVYEKLK